MPPKKASKNFQITQKSPKSTKMFEPKKHFVEQTQTSKLKTLKTPKNTFQLRHNSHGRPGRIFIMQNHLKFTLNFTGLKTFKHDNFHVV